MSKFLLSFGRSLRSSVNFIKWNLHVSPDTLENMVRTSQVVYNYSVPLLGWYGLILYDRHHQEKMKIEATQMEVSKRIHSLTFP